MPSKGRHEPARKYGNTETFKLSSGYASGTPKDVLQGSHGYSLPNLTIKIVDPLTGAVLPMGGRGEIAVKGRPWAGIVRERSKERLIDRKTRSRSRTLDVGFDLSRDAGYSTDSSPQAVSPQRSPNLSATNQPLSVLRNIPAIVELTTPDAHPFGKILGSETVTATSTIFRRVLRLSSLNTRTKS